MKREDHQAMSPNDCVLVKLTNAVREARLAGCSLLHIREGLIHAMAFSTYHLTKAGVSRVDLELFDDKVTLEVENWLKSRP